MTMHFTATNAHATVEAAIRAKEEALTAAAALTIEQLIEPEIIKLAEAGNSALILPFHETQQLVFEKIADILQENGYTATTEWPRIAKQPHLVITW